jgi:hypothetical protein
MNQDITQIQSELQALKIQSKVRGDALLQIKREHNIQLALYDKLKKKNNKYTKIILMLVILFILESGFMLYYFI